MSFLKANSASRINAPSPTPSNTSANGKRKRPAESSTPVVYSQPQDVGSGEHVRTRLQYATEHLQAHPTEWMKFEDLMSFLNLPPGHFHREQLRTLMRTEHKEIHINWNASNDTYQYKPKYNIRNAAELKGWFQHQKSAQGLPIRDLKDGWANVADEVKVMEEKKQVLVKKNKDGMPKTVWDNDSSLMHTMDPDFKNEWHKIAIPPNPDDLRNTLINVGLTAASQPRQIVAAPKGKKKKAVRRGGKQTNTHMAHILKDFSGMRK
ncbi:transcription initiation factor IIE, beta subunit [Pyrenochaeta sp. DS3sAY3a]|nr:transcription initiation factor IIE, beta subunit [Pyrenochaeta sp. DS3sAY3a]